jgi:hypothetical protein
MEPPPAPPDGALAELLPPDVRGELTDLRHPEAVDVWNGIVWSRLGRADVAWQWWDQVTSDELQPWVHAERGRVVRELGLHVAAERYDAAGLERATDVVDMCMLRLGLTADAIGRGDVERARLRLGAVAPILATLPDGPRVARQRIRRTWIEVEIAFLAREQPPVDELPWWTPEEGVTFPPVYRHGSVFHAAKGLLFAGIARDDGRLLDAAADVAPPVLGWAVELARDDRHREGALRNAREVWQGIVAPPGYEAAVARTATAQRLSTSRRPRV